MYWNLKRNIGFISLSSIFKPIQLSTFAVTATVLSVGTTAMSGLQQKYVQQAQTKQLQMSQQASISATEQAMKDKQREIDLAKYQQDREARREESVTRAGQANAGIAGITASKQIDNVLFQHILDVNYIRTQGENSLIGISNQGYSDSSAIQSNINTSKRNTISNLQILTSTATAGTKTYAGAGGFS